jgi:type I restriction enzyme S subunit
VREWEESLIGKILKIGSGKDYKHLSEGEIPVFGTGGYMTSVNEHLFEGETVCIGRKGTINKPFYYHGKLWTVDTLFYTYSYQNVLPRFVFYLFERINWLKYNEASGVPSLSKKTIEQIEIFIPSISEQKKLADFHVHLDERIQTQNKIIEALKALIKSVSQTVFNDVKDQFAKTPLGSVCHIKKGEQINSSELSKFGSYAVMNGGITPSGYHSNFNTEADTISISEGGNSCGYVQYNNSKFWSGGHCYALTKPNSTILNKYLYYFLKFNEQHITSLRVGSGLPNIQKKDLEKFEIRYPNYEDQLEIVRVLDLLTDKLEVEKSFLVLLTKQKQYLLKNLFI